MEIPIHQLESARLRMGWFLHGGMPARVKAGAWNFYVPALNLKLAYPREACVHCLHKAVPPVDRLLAGEFDGERIGRYSAEDWKQALTKTTRRRAAENFIAAERLHAAGLGPKPLGICYVRRFSSQAFGAWSETAGILIEDIQNLPPKPDATEAEILAAGVTLDGIKSCVRQQIRGYVSDLNSVIGVMPVAAEEEIEAILSQLSAQVD